MFHPNNTIPSDVLASAASNVTVRPFPDNKLTNRFRVDENWTTDAIFNVDDDVAVDCFLMTAAFKVNFPECAHHADVQGNFELPTNVDACMCGICNYCGQDC